MSSAKVEESRSAKKVTPDACSSNPAKKAAEQKASATIGQPAENLVTLLTCKKILESPDFNNEEKLLRLLTDNEITQTIKAILAEGETLVEDSVLRLSVESEGQADKKGFELVKEDIVDIFKKYGTISEVSIRSTQAFIAFDSQISALMAKKALNGYCINELGVKFVLDFVDPAMIKASTSVGGDLAASETLSYTGMGEQNSTSAMMFLKNSSKKTAASTAQSSKLTCRYDIQIDNDRDFQVAKKIIGSKGYNMKQIIDGTLFGTRYDPLKENDLIKLRLRGKGSGFKEGPAKRESDEPLHLCVSAKYIDIYTKACDLVESLLTKIYADYRAHNKGSPYSELTVKKIESFAGKPETETTLFKSKPEATRATNVPKSAQKEKFH